jgi:hypothetical protein
VVFFALKISFSLRGGLLMDELVTVNQLLNIGNTITLNAEKNKEYNELIKEKVCDQYDIISIKKKLINLLDDFKSARYLYDFPVEESIKMTPPYELRESSHQRSGISQIEKAVERHLDKQIQTTEIYYSLIKVSNKLLGSEATYLTNTFFTHKSEEDIAELLNISKTYLQKIKKRWTDLKQYCEKDD